MTDIVKYLTPHVILQQNEKLYQKDGWGALYQSDRERTHSYLKKVGMVYLDRNDCIVQILQIILHMMQ